MNAKQVINDFLDSPSEDEPDNECSHSESGESEKDVTLFLSKSDSESSDIDELTNTHLINTNEPTLGNDKVTDRFDLKLLTFSFSYSYIGHLN